MVLANVGARCLRRDLRDLRLVGFQRRRECGCEMLGLDQLEGRQRERRRPFAEQRIAGFGGSPCRHPLGRFRLAEVLPAAPLARACRHRNRSFKGVVAPLHISRSHACSKPANRPEAAADKKNGPVGKPARSCSGTRSSGKWLLPNKTRSIEAAPGGWGAENRRCSIRIGSKRQRPPRSQCFGADRCPRRDLNLTYSGIFRAANARNCLKTRRRSRTAGP